MNSSMHGLVAHKAHVDSRHSTSYQQSSQDVPSLEQTTRRQEPPLCSPLSIGYPISDAEEPWEAVKNQVAFHLCDILKNIEGHMQIVARNTVPSSELFRYCHGILAAIQRGHRLVTHLRLCHQHTKEDIAQGLNDMFLVISGYAELSLLVLHKEVRTYEHCQEALAAVDRARNLVQKIFTAH